jgi:hypothetical protein
LKAANEGRKKATSSSENMSSLQQIIHLAKKMGARLGKGEILQQTVFTYKSNIIFTLNEIFFGELPYL